MYSFRILSILLSDNGFNDDKVAFIAKDPVTLGYGLTRSHAEGAKAPHRESAPVSVGKRP